MLVHEFTYSEKVVGGGFLKRSPVRWIRQVKYFSMAALGGLVRAGRMGGGKLRHRAFALGPLAWEPALGEVFLPISPWTGGSEAAAGKGCGECAAPVSFCKRDGAKTCGYANSREMGNWP